MWRWIVLALMVANLALFAWSQGVLGLVGAAPKNDRDPARLEQQVRPEAVRVLPGGAVAPRRPRDPPAAPASALPSATTSQADDAVPLR